MSRYTLELKEIIRSNNYDKYYTGTTRIDEYITNGNNIFDFEYNFYNEECKKDFEKKFKEFYYFYEIGQETIERFKYMLKFRLDTIYPYYKQLYQAQQELLKQDLFSTDISTDTINIEHNSNGTNKHTGNSSVNSTTNNNGVSDTTGISTTINDTKFSNTPQNRLDNIDNFLTTFTNDQNDNTSDTKTNTNATTELKSNNSDTSVISHNDISNDKHISNRSSRSGNIGTIFDTFVKTGIINLDMEIIKECSDLFMQVY